MKGNIRVRLDRIEAGMPAPEDGPSGASKKLRAVLDEMAALKASGARCLRGGVVVEGEDVPGRILGPGYTHGDLVRLAAERAADGGRSAGTRCPRPWSPSGACRGEARTAGTSSRSRRGAPMGLRRRLKRLEHDHGFEEVVLVTGDGEELAYRGDPLDLVVEQWFATVEGRPVEHPLAAYLDRGLCLKHPERVSDPLWKTLDGGRGASYGPV